MLDLSSLGPVIRQRRRMLGLSQERLAHLCGMSRQTLSGLEQGSLNDLGYNRLVRLMALLGLDSPAPTLKARQRKQGLWMAAKTASVSYKRELDVNALAQTLATGEVPSQYVAQIAHLLDEAPLQLLVMAVEETAQSKHIRPDQVWGNVSRLAVDLGSVREDQLA